MFAVATPNPAAVPETYVRQHIREIAPGKMGLVKVDGETWSARSSHGQTVKEGVQVIVVRIKGAHLVVQEVESKKQ